MQIGLFLPVKKDIRWDLARQMGLKKVIAKAAPELTDELPPYDLNTLQKQYERFAANGLQWVCLEGDEFDMSRIKLGLPGRDDAIELYKNMLRNMGQVGIPMICFNFMAEIGWFRSQTNLPERGGALTTGFNINDINNNRLTQAGEVSEEQMWENFSYFIKAVIPVAQEAGVKMALHPDDPPISPLHGIGRIFTSADSFRKAIKIANSDNFGITFCQATFKAMGEDIFKLISEFGKMEKIFFVHLRDIEGDKYSFQETFHDNGPTNMAKAIKTYNDAGVDCLLRPDHTPSMAGEDNSDPGYQMQGRLFAVGYIRGLLDSLCVVNNDK